MDVFDLVAKIRLDSSEYEDGVGKAKGTFSTLATGVKDGLATVAKVGAAAVAAGVAGVTALTKMGVEGYAQYEQLAGGAKLMWGDAYSYIADKASGAYATVQMSQNDYLQQVNGFAVGLKTALGGNEQAAAVLADRIITAEADIVAATGNTQENVQNAFNGIMKNNFSMIDNLGLGVTATKEGFQTMIDSVNAYNAEHGKSTQYQIDNVADCQAALLDYIEMQGMSGYAGMEAANSIEGSVSMMKAAWENLVVGMADSSSNMDMLINNFVESTATAAKNLLPRIEQTLSGIAQVIERLAPIIGEAVPQLIESVLPSLLSAGINLVAGIVSGIASAAPGIYQAFLDAIYMALTDVFGMSEESANTFVGTFDGIVQELIAFIKAIPVALNWMVEQAQTEGTIFNGIWETIKTVVSAAVEIIKNTLKLFTAVLTGDWSAAWTAVEDILTAATDAINDTITTVLNAVISFISTSIEKIVSFLSERFEVMRKDAAEIWGNIKADISKVWEGIKSVVSSVLDNVKSNITAMWNDIKSVTSTVWNGIKTTMANIWKNIKTNISDAINEAKKVITTAWNSIKSTTSTVWNGIKTTIANIWKNIKDNTSSVVNEAKKAVTTAFNAIKSAISTAMDGVKSTVTKVWDAVKSAINTVMTAIKSTIKSAWDNVKSTVSSAMNGVKSTITSVWNNVKSTVSSAVSGVKTSISDGLRSARDTVSTVLDSIKNKFSSIFEGAKTVVKNGINAIKGFFNFNWELPKIKLPHFSISGEFSLDPPSIPTFSISWYKNAYNRAMVLDSPTIFGYSAASGKYLGGGDGNGNEVVAGESYLLGMIGQVVESKTAGQNEKIISLLSALLEVTAGGNEEMIRALMSDRTFAVGEREFARLVKTYA